MATWTILSMEYENNASEDKLVVISAAQGQDGVGYARKVFTNTLSGVVGPAPLTPYNQLTESQVISLVQADLGPTVVTDAETYVDAQATIKKEQIEELYNRSNVQLIPQAKNTSKGSLPSKLPNLLVSGCKILVITDKNSELEQLFKKNNLHLIVTSWSQEKLLDSLKLLLKIKNNTSNQQQIAKKLFTIEEMIRKVLL